MPIFRQLIELLGIFTGLVFGTAGFAQTKLLVSLLGLLLALLAVAYWIFLESRYGYGREWWGMLFRYFLQARLKFKQLKSDWQKVKRVFLVDPIRSVFIARELFATVIDLYGYPGKTLPEKLSAFPPKIIPNLERLQKALAAIDLIEAKGITVEITQAEILAVLRELEEALVALLLLNREDCWVTPSTSPTTP